MGNKIDPADDWPGWALFVLYMLREIPWRSILLTIAFALFYIGFLVLLAAGFVYLYTNRCNMI